VCIGARALKWIGGEKRRIRSLPRASGWTKQRDSPAPSGKTFMELYCERRPGG